MLMHLVWTLVNSELLYNLPHTQWTLEVTLQNWPMSVGEAQKQKQSIIGIAGLQT